VESIKYKKRHREGEFCGWGKDGIRVDQGEGGDAGGFKSNEMDRSEGFGEGAGGG